MRRGLGFTLALLVLLVVVPTAQGSYHLMKIREVYAGTEAADNQDFIELQMHAPGQNFVSGRTLSIYTAGGFLSSNPFTANVPRGDNQRTILIASPAAESAFGVQADLELDDNNNVTANGAACFDTVDCVKWGVPTGLPTLPSPVGAAEGTIPSGKSITRSIAGGCPTLLEPADDTNNSSADFALGAPSPRSNSVTPTEVLCDGGSGGAPDTEITKAPKNKTEKRKAKYKFESSEPSSSFECAIDRQIKKDKFKPCESPYKKRVDDGKHKFRVAAIDADGNVDPTPAKDKFKVLD